MAHLRLVDARHGGVWELPVLGEIAAPPAVVIRPDGHVAWAGRPHAPELPQACDLVRSGRQPSATTSIINVPVAGTRAIAGSSAVLSDNSRSTERNRRDRGLCGSLGRKMG
jgi:hypothetical protein